jgi:hypothetical protein
MGDSFLWSVEKCDKSTLKMMKKQEMHLENGKNLL